MPKSKKRSTSRGPASRPTGEVSTTRPMGQTSATPPANDAKLDRRERRLEKRRATPKRATGAPLYMIGGGLAVIAVLAVVVYLIMNQPPRPVETGRQVPGQGQAHIVRGQAHAPYNTTPPTSGWHYAGEANWGVHTQPLEDELQVHNLEHGGVLVQYSCPEGCPDLVEKLKGVVGRYRSKVILAPYGKPLPNRIALTAWTWIDTFDEFDEARIVNFIEARKNKAPEQVPD